MRNASAWTGLGTGNFKAITKVHKAVRQGVLPCVRSLRCVDCGAPAKHYDHRDYNKPLQVDPVCASCNHLRGPAIPRKGFFTEFFETEYSEYSSRKRLKQLLAVVGIEADVSGLPGRIKFEHWLPYKEALLEWEKAA